MTYRVARALTLDEMLAVKLAIMEAADPVEALVGALKTTFNCLLADEGSTWDQEESIKGWEFAISHSQWCDIGAWLLQAADKVIRLDAPSVLLDWMNKGPSADETLDVGAASLTD